MFAASLLAALTLELSDAGCPTEERLRAYMSELLPSVGVQPNERVRLWHEEGVLQLALYSETGEKLAEKALLGADSCSAQERAAAVTISAWMLGLHPELGEKSSTTSVRQGQPSRESRESNVTAQPRAPLQPATEHHSRFSPLPRRGFAHWFLGGAGVMNGLRVPRFAVSASWLLMHESGLGLELVAQAPTRPGEPFAGGVIRWWRPTLTLAGLWRTRLSGPLALDLGAGPTLGFLSLAGSGYDVDESTNGVEPAMAASVRLTHLSPLWVGVRACYSLREQRVLVDGFGESLKLPRWDIFGSLGIQLR